MIGNNKLTARRLDNLACDLILGVHRSQVHLALFDSMRQGTLSNLLSLWFHGDIQKQAPLKMEKCLLRLGAVQLKTVLRLDCIEFSQKSSSNQLYLWSDSVLYVARLKMG